MDDQIEIDVSGIHDEKTLHERLFTLLKLPDYYGMNWDAFDEYRKDFPISISHDINTISFRIQNGPIKEVGKNGCQVTDIIVVAKHVFEGLNKKFPCYENELTIGYLNLAMTWQEKRTKDREARQVEGTSNK